MKMILPLFFAVLTLHTEAQEVWSLRYQPAQNTDVHAIAGRPGLYLVCTPSNYQSELVNGVDLRDAFRSTDGINWTVTRLPYPRQMIYTGTTFLGANENEIWTSPDGIAWAKSSGDGPEYSRPTGIAVGAGVFVVAFQNGRILRATSPAGPWARQLSPLESIYSVAFGQGVFLAATGYGTSAVSSDGITWTFREGNTPTYIKFAKGRFYSAEYSSLDGGNTWGYHPGSATSLPDGERFDADSTTYVFAKSQNGILTTKDFLTWTPRAAGTSSYIQRIAFCGDLWVAADDNGKIVTSSVATAPALSAPSVTIPPAVDLTWPSITGRFYQVQTSPNNLMWTDTGLPLAGNGSTLRFTAPATLAKSFFRVVVR